MKVTFANNHELLLQLHKLLIFCTILPSINLCIKFVLYLAGTNNEQHGISKSGDFMRVYRQLRYLKRQFVKLIYCFSSY